MKKIVRYQDLIKEAFKYRRGEIRQDLCAEAQKGFSECYRSISLFILEGKYSG
jgi:hypothetical protein